MNLFDGIDAVCIVKPMSADMHAYMQRQSEWAKNQPPEEELNCLHCGRKVEECDDNYDPICGDCADERRSSQHADAADRRRDERWADQGESANED